MTGRSDEYVTVHATLKSRTDKGALIDHDVLDEPVWIPRSCLHFLSDQIVAEAAIDGTVELRLMEWVATQKGLI